MGNNRNKTVSILMRDIFIIYLISFIAILALTTIFSYTNGEVITDNLMLHFRSYLLGSIHTGENILSVRLENIGIFAIHFILFFAYFFIWLTDNCMGELCEPVLCLLIGLLLTIFLRENFLFCLPEALALASLIIICRKTIFKNISINDGVVIMINHIVAILVSIIGIVIFIIRYIA